LRNSRFVPECAPYRDHLRAEAGGNDYPAEQTGVISIPVRGPEDTKLAVEAIMACLGGDQQDLQI
jgi:hypothetical protein